jgi:hypothetical protein
VDSTAVPVGAALLLSIASSLVATLAIIAAETHKTVNLSVTSPVNGRFPTDGLTRRDPRLFATSAILGGAEAHSHIAPPKLAP